MIEVAFVRLPDPSRMLRGGYEHVSFGNAQSVYSIFHRAGTAVRGFRMPPLRGNRWFPYSLA